ncbi:FHA domain-containing protein [Rhizobium leguminosarum]|uniref:FHA domain-containing protein n=1 Tax=Rhizobium leguminosarum TaxID=384 RepID=UPI001C95C5B7|nr:FHA domain-containing protein [Rhizobium leguminosarum]MBY5918459.1 FHA domain-containing protein [Rhizobium leguminosarum]
MNTEDPDDIPTRALGRANPPKPAFADDDAPTARIAKPSRLPQPEPSPVPSPAAIVETTHAVTRRISGPRRLETFVEPQAHSRLQSFSSQPAREPVELPVGFVVIVSGPGRGSHFPIYNGMNSLGRDASNTIVIDFGDDKISRESHCFLTFDDEDGAFWIQHGGKSNLVRLNDKPVMEPVAMTDGDYIRVGASKFRFVALCNASFNWSMFE